jgi:hypothetical protein
MCRISGRLSKSIPGRRFGFGQGRCTVRAEVAEDAGGEQLGELAAAVGGGRVGRGVRHRRLASGGGDEPRPRGTYAVRARTGRANLGRGAETTRGLAAPWAAARGGRSVPVSCVS